jgi:hypothetical protein
MSPNQNGRFLTQNTWQKLACVRPPADPASLHQRSTVVIRYALLPITSGDSFTVHHRSATFRRFCSHRVATEGATDEESVGRKPESTMRVTG